MGERGRAWWCEEACEKVEAMPGHRLAGARYGSVWAVDLWDGGIRIGKWGKKWVLLILDRCLPLGLLYRDWVLNVSCHMLDILSDAFCRVWAWEFAICMSILHVTWMGLRLRISFCLEFAALQISSELLDG